MYLYCIYSKYNHAYFIHLALVNFSLMLSNVKIFNLQLHYYKKNYCAIILPNIYQMIFQRVAINLGVESYPL